MATPCKTRPVRPGPLLLLAALCVLPAGAPAAAPSPSDIADATTAAQDGLAAAETLLQAYFPAHTFDPVGQPRPWRFWGGDPTETIEPASDFPVQDAVNPSFAVEVDGDPTNSDPTPRTMVIDGTARGYSGVHSPGTYATNGNPYVLKVSDLSGRIHVNDGIEDGPGGSVSQNLKRLLNVLGVILGEASLGDRILAGRPVGGYGSLDDLLPALGSQASLDRVRDFLCANAWVDRNVANPVPLSAVTLSRYPVQYYRGTSPLYRFGSSVDSLGRELLSTGTANTIPSAGAPVPPEQEAVSVYGLDQLNPQWIEIVGRAPVNVNTAPREVLVALLSNLQGFFIAERPRNNARWQGELMVSLKIENSFSHSGTEGDEYGYLTDTYPIAGPTGAGGISPFDIADEIIACRNLRRSSRVDYASVPWGGPFRSWNQFNLFVDNLVTVGLLDDPRPVHVAYAEEGVDPTGYGPIITSDPHERLHASRAIADVIKANFNPNLHLNELNPDANLHLRVDKTDLYVNSTEFCFVPTGYFEVQAVGKVLKPTDGQTDALLSTNNALMVQVKTTSVIRLYDLYRETTQKQFYAGTLTTRTTAIDTSNNATLEIGPEPDNGVFPGNLGAPGAPDNEWDGYLALPTVGGPWHAGAPAKARNTLATTLSYPNQPHLSAALHVHYGLDMDACDHVLDRREIAGKSVPESEVHNYPSQVNGAPLPYGRPNDPTKGAHRLARSFRINGGPPPALAPAAPSDLRVDGAYAERNSAPAYYAHQGGLHLWDFNTQNAHGLVSFWIKPSFTPELTGKMRKFWDMGRHHDPCAQDLNVWPFGLVFMPVQYNPSLSDANAPLWWHNNMGKFQSRSLYFGSMQWHSDEQFDASTSNGHAFGKITTCLNHLGHPDEATSPSPLQAHRWINVAFSWGLNGASDPTGNLSQLYVNGTAAYSKFSYTSMTTFADGIDRMNGFNLHAGGAFNHMRIGGTSRISDAAYALATSGGGYRGNYSSDATIDELYVWSTDVGNPPDLLWQRGRYFNLRGQTGGEGLFTSQAINLPPASGGGSPAVKVLGASWTWYGDGTDPSTGARTLFDCSGNILGMPNLDLKPAVKVSVLDGTLTYGPFSDDGFSPVLSLSGTTPAIADPTNVHYAVHFQLSPTGSAPILLTTPVFDDVTLYWNNGAASGTVSTTPPAVILPPPPVTGGGGGGGGGGCGLLGAEALLIALALRRRRIP